MKYRVDLYRMLTASVIVEADNEDVAAAIAANTSMNELTWEFCEPADYDKIPVVIEPAADPDLYDIDVSPVEMDVDWMGVLDAGGQPPKLRSDTN